MEDLPLEPEPPLPPFPHWMDPYHARLAFSRQRVRGGTLVDNWRMVSHVPVPMGDPMPREELRRLLTLARIAPQELDL